MMTRSLAFCSLLASSLAVAQGKPLEDRKAITYNEIERGFFFGVSAGFWGTINPPAGPMSAQYFSPGQAALVEIGFDVGERVSPALFFLATSNRMGSDYTGTVRTCGAGGSRECTTGETPQAVRSGDFGSVAPGVGARIRIAGFKDAQEVTRTWFYARVGGAFVIYQPSALISQADVLLFAGPGLEYFTRLRHFSIGLDANFNFGVLTQSVGFSVLPFVRYAGF
ncbi:MAG: adventurous gliding motility protein CglE [Myxococcales bacterium]|nr:adventurous gliding motility protein CglE [Myxococcales bacterium]